MNKDRFVAIDALKSYNPIYSKHADISYPDVELEKNPSDTLLSIVYATDPRTGLPVGDLQYFVSDKANPQVKEFILNNLMSDVSSARNISNPSGLSDDALLELSRGSDESVDSYVLRLGHEIDTFKFFQEQMKKKNVPDNPQEPAVSSQ